MLTCDQIPTFMQIDLCLADSWQKARPIFRYFTSLSYLVSLLRVFLLKICQKSIKWHKNWCINIFHYYATFLLNKIFRLFTAKNANLSISIYINGSWSHYIRLAPRILREQEKARWPKICQNDRIGM